MRDDKILSGLALASIVVGSIFVLMIIIKQIKGFWHVRLPWCSQSSDARILTFCSEGGEFQRFPETSRNISRTSSARHHKLLRRPIRKLLRRLVSFSAPSTTHQRQMKSVFCRIGTASCWTRFKQECRMHSHLNVLLHTYSVV